MKACLSFESGVASFEEMRSVVMISLGVLPWVSVSVRLLAGGTTTTSKAMMTEAQGGGKKRLRFRTFDLSSVDMPSDSKDAAKQPSEVPSDMPGKCLAAFDCRGCFR